MNNLDKVNKKVPWTLFCITSDLQTLTHTLSLTPLYAQTSFLQHALSLTEYFTTENLTEMAGVSYQKY